MGGFDGWEIVPYDKHIKERQLYNLFLLVRNGKSATLQTTVSVYDLINALYVEIYVEPSHRFIRIVPKEKETAFSRTITTDHKTKAQIAGGQKLVEIGLPAGKYVMTADNLIFKKG